MKKILSFLLCLVLVVGIGVGAFMFLKPNQKASAVMTLETNPEIQLVLDQNNKVMSVNAINEDGEKLMLSVNFVGLSAEKAAEKFADAATKYLSNKNSANSLYLNEINGDLNVNITIACEDNTSEKYTELKKDVKNSVNNYFKEAKIMAGAIVNVTEDIKAEIEKLGYEISNYANKTYEEIMADVIVKAEELENVAILNRDQIFNKYEELKTSFSSMFNLEEQINNYKVDINAKKLELAQKKEELKTANEWDKIAITATITALETALEQVEELLNTVKEQYNEFKSDYDKQINNFIKQVESQSKTLLNEIETTMKTAMESGKTILDNFTAEMQQKGESLITSIEQYQNSLNA